MKWIKRLFYTLSAILALTLLGLTAFIVTFDANDYRPQLVKLVKQHTGRDLVIDGNIDLILFSWRPGLTLGGVSLSNAPGFASAPFAELGSAAIELEWLPLLRERALKVVRIELAGLRLRLERNAAGVANWDDLAGTGAATEPAAAAKATPKPPANAAAPLAALTLGELRILDAQVEWRDAQAGTEARVNRFDLTSGRVRIGEPFPLKFGLDLDSREPQLQARIDFDGMVSADPGSQRYSVANLVLAVNAVDASGKLLPVPRVDLDLAADVDIDLGAETAQLSEFKLTALGVSLSGAGQVKSFASAPAFDARLAVAPFDLRALMARLNIEVPVTADPDVLKSVGVEIDATGDIDAVDVSRLAVRLDQSTLLGRLGATGLQARPAVRFTLALDNLDADRYLPPPPPSPPPGSAAPAPSDAPLPIPVQLLRDLDIDGRFSAGSLQISKSKLQELELGIRADQGQIKLDPIAVNLYEGILRGDLGVDARTDVPAVALKLKLAGVRSEPLLKDVLDMDLVRGKADSDIALTTAGVRVSEFKANLNGRIGVSFTDGALKGFNLAGLLREAEARLKKRSLDDAKSERTTDFAAMAISATVVNGVLHTDDLDVRAPLLRLGGAGEVNLVSEQIDYLAQVTVTDKQTGQGGATSDQLHGLTVPVRVKGSFADPKISIELAKALEQRAREQLQQKAAEVERELSQKLDAEKARLKQQADQESAKLKSAVEAKKAEAQTRVDAEKARLEADKAEAEAQLRADRDAEKARAEKKLKEQLGDQLKKLF